MLNKTIPTNASLLASCNVPGVALHAADQTPNRKACASKGNIRKALLIVAVTLLLTNLSGCAGLGQLCATANGYTGTIDGKPFAVVPAKCAVLSGKSL